MAVIFRYQAFLSESVVQNYFLLFLNQNNYVLGTQKNHLDIRLEAVVNNR